MSYYVQIYVSQQFACGVWHLAGHTRGGPALSCTARPATYLFEEKCVDHFTSGANQFTDGELILLETEFMNKNHLIHLLFLS